MQQLSPIIARRARARRWRSPPPIPTPRSSPAAPTCCSFCKQGPAARQQLIDISRLPLDRIEPQRPTRIRIGALARLADVARPPRRSDATTRRWPRRSRPARRRRCATSRPSAATCCSAPAAATSAAPTCPATSAQPGSGCAARNGENRLHAIFGTSLHCAATHASDLAVALLALDARVHVRRHEARACCRSPSCSACPATRRSATARSSRAS